MKYNILPTVYTNEQNLLESIISLHSPSGIELDPMYFKGNFYKRIKTPDIILDINSQIPKCIKSDARFLPINSNSIKSIILDPPFMFGIHGKTTSYYSSRTHGILHNFNELELLYKSIMAEAKRVLINKGILFFKCQDYTDNTTIMIHCYVWKWALELGFYPKDLAILHLPKNKIANPYLKQRHLRKVHSYFWVFVNKRIQNTRTASV
jgi:hypothetical protein